MEDKDINNEAKDIHHDHDEIVNINNLSLQLSLLKDKFKVIETIRNRNNNADITQELSLDITVEG
jgi:hypothetical protein